MAVGDDVLLLIAIAFAVVVPLCTVATVNAPPPVSWIAKWVVYGSCALLSVVLVVWFIF
jgi:hypothetical protein